MRGPLVAAAALVALLAAAGATWWVVQGPSSAEEAGPGAAQPAPAAPGGSGALHATGQGDGGRTEAPGEAPAEPPTVPGTAVDAGHLAIEVAVSDPDGRAIPAARVALEAPASARTRADAEGLARLEVPVDARRITLRVDAPGFHHERLTQPLAARVDVTLYPAVTAHGHVLDHETKTPLEGAVVRLDDGHEGCAPVEVTCDEEGAFALEGVPVGSDFLVTASAAGHADSGLPVQLLSADEAADLELELEASTALQLVLVDHLTGRPVPGARLVGLDDSPVSDAAGGLDAGRLAPASATDVLVRVEAAGYCTLTRTLRREEWADTGTVTVPLLPGARFEGRVSDPEDEPVAGASVQAVLMLRGGLPTVDVPGWHRDWYLGPFQLEPVQTGADGTFVSASVPPQGTGWRIEVSAAGFATKRVDPGPTAQPGQATWVEVKLELPSTGTIRGTLSLHGEPIAGTVRWRGASEQGFAAADADGHFELQGVETGAVTLEPVPGDATRRYGKLVDTQVQVTLAPGETIAQDLDVELELARTSGRVVTQLGEGVAGAEVLATLSAAQASVTTTSRADGAFELELPVTPQAWRLRVRGPWNTRAVETHAGASDVTLVVTQVGRLRVRLVDVGSGATLRRFEVRGGPPGDAQRFLASTSRDVPDPSGWVELEAPTGPLDLVARALDEGYLPVTGSVGVPAQGAPAAQLELRTRRGNRVDLVLAADCERPPRGRRIYLLEEPVAARLPAAGSPQARWQALLDQQHGADPLDLRARAVAFDLQRSATLRGLPDGRYRLVDIDGGVLEPAGIELSGADGGPIEVRWSLP